MKVSLLGCSGDMVRRLVALYVTAVVAVATAAEAAAHGLLGQPFGGNSAPRRPPPRHRAALTAATPTVADDNMVAMLEVRECVLCMAAGGEGRGGREHVYGMSA